MQAGGGMALKAVNYETVFCPRLVPEKKGDPCSYFPVIVKISKPFIDTTLQAVAVTYIPGYGMYRTVDLVFKIVGAYRKSAVCLVGTCAKSFFPKKYLVSAIGEKLGLKIPITILLGGSVSSLVSQIVFVTITGSIIPQKCVEGIEKVLPAALQLFHSNDSEIVDDYVCVDVESNEEDYVVVDIGSGC